jgi:hypothetical protein
MVTVVALYGTFTTVNQLKKLKHTLKSRLKISIMVAIMQESQLLFLTMERTKELR